MVSVTGLTAARMEAIEDQSVVSGVITGDDLILTQFGGGVINAGNVRGPIGPQGVPGEVTTADLNAAIASAHADGAITTAQLADNAVTSVKLANSAVGVNQIANGSVSNAKLADASVKSNNIFNASVVEDKIASNAVTSDKIASNAVVAGKIASNAVTDTKIASNAVTSAKILDGAVTTAKMANFSVTGSKLAPVTGYALNTNAGWTGSIDYFKIGNVVTAYYHGECTSPTAIMGTLGSAYWPLSTQYFIVYYRYNGVRENLPGTIDFNGKVDVAGLHGFSCTEITWRLTYLTI